ncbi:hypothetical protein GGS23DRAFT_589081 [Durotheca rogersii]|uniref:uncharacterized protein n=1 Tax=Durotheca rogersii TaxID=419775 RepID=UPI0022211832|nr:uncharacterized protein GGS23DRAFT_589081 [Durotheca rogersii]KAI5856221.1 hypothetical protein GGS23DRAFT_589081 [Durotheca rogersii]
MSPRPLGKGLLGGDESPAQVRSPRTCVISMPSTRSFVLTILLGLFVAVGLANAVFHQRSPEQDPAEGADRLVGHQDDSNFSRLLSSASPQALHEFLHAYLPGTYKHGVYDSDQSALEVIHANDPELATSIVQLAKRQQSANDTAVSTTSAASTDSGTVVTTTTPTETSTVDPPSSPSSSSPATSPDATTPPPQTTTTDVGTTTTSTPTSTSQPSSLTLPTTSESADGSSLFASTLTTATPSSSGSTRPTRVSTFTSTLPGGAVTTITSVEVVTPGPEEATTTSGSSGSLQSGFAAPLARRRVAEVVIGAIIGGAVLV